MLQLTHVLTKVDGTHRSRGSELRCGRVDRLRRQRLRPLLVPPLGEGYPREEGKENAEHADLRVEYDGDLRGRVWELVKDDEDR